jgi:hypothetical protein
MCVCIHTPYAQNNKSNKERHVRTDQRQLPSGAWTSHTWRDSSHGTSRTHAFSGPLCVSVCVCMCVCMYACMRLLSWYLAYSCFFWSSLHTCVFVCVHAYTYVPCRSIYKYMCAFTHSHTRTHTQIGPEYVFFLGGCNLSRKSVEEAP